MILFGRTLFGGPVAGRIVTASGTAMGTVSVAATARRTAYPRAPYVKVTGVATVAGSCTKTVSCTGMAVLASAASSAGEHADFFVGGASRAPASVAGRAKAEFFDSGDAAASLSTKGSAAKTYRMRPAGRCLAVATVAGDADLHVLAETIPLLCSALPFGTTYQVGRGSCAASAALAVDAVRVQPAITAAVGTATGEAIAHTEFFGRGQSDASVELRAELAQYVSNFYGTSPPTGALVVDAYGTTVASAEAQALDLYVHSVCLVVGRSAAAAAVERARLARGNCAPQSSGTGYGVIVVKAEAGGQLLSEAGGEGTCQFIAGGVSVVLAEGAGIAVARGAFAARSSTTGTATVVAAASRLLARSAVVAAASPRGAAIRTVSAGGPAAGVSALHCRPKASLNAKSALSAVGKGAGYPIFWPKKQAAGTAAAVASAAGYVSVNNAVPAPPTRTVAVERNERVVTVPPQERLVTVDRSSRAMAA